MKKIILFLIVIFNYTCYGQDTTGLIVQRIVASKSGINTFYLPRKNSATIVLNSSKLDVQALMNIAFFRKTYIEYDLIEKTTDLIQRVYPFGIKDSCDYISYPGDYRISRLGTQRSPEGNEHIEAFILSRETEFKNETAYKITEDNLKQLLEFIFFYCTNHGQTNFKIELDETGTVIEEISIGF